jgi:3-dehydroquinate dehydratase type I
MICIPVFEPTTEAAIEAMKEAAGQADIIELRLDAMPAPDVEALLAGRPQRPLIVTARRPDEGGSFSWPEKKKVDMLVKAAECGADYIDIELNTSPELRQQLIERKANAAVIVSWHNLMHTPDRTTLRRQVRLAFEAGADVCKIVTFARDFDDNGRMLEVVADAARRGKPIIGFCMGDLGKFSRIATLYMGGRLTFAHLRHNRAVAPGMPSVEELKKYLSDFNYLPASCAACHQVADVPERNED